MISFIFQLGIECFKQILFVYSHGLLKVYLDISEHDELMRYLNLLEPFLVKDFMARVPRKGPAIPSWNVAACQQLLRAFMPKDLINGYFRRGRRAVGHPWYAHRQQAMFSK